jgi:ketosteroid isomerase-like protein
MALQPGSRVRSAFFRRNALAGWGAWLRGDFEAMGIRLSPAFQYEPPHEWVAVGMREVYRGHAGLREWSADMHEAWEWIENTPLEIIDAGDPVVFVNSIRIRARGSGLEFAYRSALVCWLERGLIVRERDYLAADEALPALGIAVRP